MKYEDWLKEDHPCPFCESEHRELLGNELAYLSYATAPYLPDHLLVIPRRHVVSFQDMTLDEMHAIDAMQRAGVKALRALGHANVSILVRDGDNIGKSIAHLHYHLIPDITIGNKDRAGGDRFMLSEGEENAVKTRVVSALGK